MRFAKLSTLGLLLGTLLFAFSLTPSLGPRTYVMQGVISGLSLSIGYSMGVLFTGLWHYFGFRKPPSDYKDLLTLIAAILLFILCAFFLWKSSEWQNALRALMQLSPNTETELMLQGIIALGIFLFTLLLFRVFRALGKFIGTKLHAFIPKRFAKLVGFVAAILIFWGLVNGVLLQTLYRTAEHSYQKIDALIQTNLNNPNNPLKTGSNQSLVRWQDLGTQGRNYISLGPTPEQIRQLTSPTALEPLRIYVGLNAAPNPQARAQLALEELKRVKAFERSVLLLMTPTGTGWIDPSGIDTVEYLMHGDIASVAVQYSYLPSPLALAMYASYGAETARAEFDTIYRYWATLPQDKRPKLYLYGISLGSRNSDLSFDLFDIINDPPQGVLWVGPPFNSRTHTKVTQERNLNSPQWLPTFRDSSVIRFMNHENPKPQANLAWGNFRMIYLQYASDPIVFFAPESFYQEPDWLKAPRGVDVLPQLQWFPAVTMLQTAADMLLVSAPIGYGHNYAPEDYINAWMALIEPPNWTPDQLTTLKAYFKTKPIPYD